ncbi:MAG: 30S ribosomal protein S4 [Candidatus Micrarchaeia archaeon]
MGAPKRNKKKYERPASMWNKERIDEEHKIKKEYGLKKLGELWRPASEIRRVRRNAREVLSGNATEKVGKEIIARLASYNIVSENAIPDDILVIKPQSLLDRRLQTVVYKKGLAKTIKQSRQLITHGFISINGRKIKSPSYLVKKNEENAINYYKKFSLDTLPPKTNDAINEAADKGSEADVKNE